MLSDNALKNYALHPLKTFFSQSIPFNSNNTIKLEINDLSALKALYISKEVSYLNVTYVGRNIRGEKAEFYSIAKTLLDKNPNLTNVILSDKAEQVLFIKGKYMEGLNSPYEFFYDLKNEAAEVSINSQPAQTLSLAGENSLTTTIAELKAIASNVAEIVKAKAIEIKENIKEAVSDAAIKTQVKTAELKENIKEAADKASNKIAEVKEKAQDKATEASNKLAEVKEKAQDKATEASNKLAEVKEKAQDKATEAHNKLVEVKEKVQDKATEAHNKLVEVKEKAQDKAAEAHNKLVEVKEKTQDKAAEIREHLQNKNLVIENSALKPTIITSHFGEVPTVEAPAVVVAGDSMEQPLAIIA